MKYLILVLPLLFFLPANSSANCTSCDTENTSQGLQYYPEDTDICGSVEYVKRDLVVQGDQSPISYILDGNDRQKSFAAIEFRLWMPPFKDLTNGAVATITVLKDDPSQNARVDFMADKAQMAFEDRGFLCINLYDMSSFTWERRAKLLGTSRIIEMAQLGSKLKVRLDYSLGPEQRPENLDKRLNLKK